MIGSTIYLTFHLQFVLGMGALQAGLASLPLPIATMVLAPIATKLLPVIGPRPQLIVGPLIAAVGLFLLSGITPDGAYFVQIAPGLVLLGIGMGFVFIPLQNLALARVAPHDAGVTSAVANSAMQIGGSIGLSVFTAVYAASVGGHAQADVSPQQLSDAYGLTFIVGAILMIAASIIAATMVRGTKEELLPAQNIPVLAAH
jgi:MFS family permease